MMLRELYRGNSTKLNSDSLKKRDLREASDANESNLSRYMTVTLDFLIKNSYLRKINYAFLFIWIEEVNIKL